MRIIRLSVLVVASFGLLPLRAEAGKPADPIEEVTAAAGRVEVGAQQVQAGIGESHAVAEAINQATGVSISPILGLAWVGYREYQQHQARPAHLRGDLPLYAHPYFLMLAVFLGAVLFIGHRLPGRWFSKNVKLWENKATGAIAMVASGNWMALATGNEIGTGLASAADLILPSAYAATGAGGAPPVLFEYLGAGVGWLTGFAVSAAVWLVGHSVNVLALVSPVGVVDWVLKTIKGSALGFLAMFAWMSPWMGIVFSLAYILVAALLAGWSFRLMVFGLVFSSDFLLLRSRKQKVQSDNLRAFSASGLEGVPVRTYGNVVPVEGGLEFQYRPWLVLKRRALPIDRAALIVERGLVSPVLIRGAQQPNGNESTLFRFPPRFRPHGDAIAAVLGGLQVHDCRALRGMKAAWAWIKDQFGENRRAQQAAPKVMPEPTA